MHARILSPLLLLPLIGCAGSSNESGVMVDANGKTTATAPAAKSSAEFSRSNPVGLATHNPGAGGMGVAMGGGSMAYAKAGSARPADASVVGVSGGGGGTQESAPPKGAPAVERKILYSADVDVVVEDFPKLEAALLAAVKRHGGYIADTDVNGSAGSSRSARWKIRVPIDAFNDFLVDASKLGELTRRQIHSQDVTEEFYDLEARIKNKKVEETRLLKHLQDSTGKLEEILAAERELSRVREEVERQEGRLRLLANLASLTTINVMAVERTNYVPATAPNFGTRAYRRLADSAWGVVETVQALILWGLGMLPWLPFLLILGAIVLVLLRAVRHRVAAQIAARSAPRPTPP